MPRTTSPSTPDRHVRETARMPRSLRHPFATTGPTHRGRAAIAAAVIGLCLAAGLGPASATAGPTQTRALIPPASTTVAEGGGIAAGIAATSTTTAATDFPAGHHAYHTYAELTTELAAVAAAHPSIVKR